MSLNLRGLHAASVREDEAALAQTLVREQRLRHARAAADVALAEAKRAVEDLAREMRQLQDVQKSIMFKLASSRAALDRECFLALPHDVLRCIFAEVVADDRTHAPFALATVCVRWRRISLGSPSLWSTIDLRPSSDFYGSNIEQILATEYDRAALLLSRSGSAPLSISGPSCVRSNDRILHQMHRIFSLLGAHVSRWKYASLELPTGLAPSSLDFLKGPTPLLAELSVSGPWLRSGKKMAPLDGGYLPYAPRLKYLSIAYGAGLACSTGFGFPAMKTLSFHLCTCTNDQVLDLIRASSKSLQALFLHTAWTEGPRTPLHLPNLSRLSFSPACQTIISAPGTLISTPALTNLTLHTWTIPDIDDAYVPFLDAVSSTVRELTLEGSLSRGPLLVLAHLRNLDQLNFGYDLESSFSSDGALDLLCDDPSVWPRLKCVTNLAFRAKNCASSEAILRFVASRTGNLPERNERTGVSRPCMLREFTMKWGAPEWLVAEVQRLVKFPSTATT